MWKTFFPNATIVIDRFHVVRYVTWALENVRKRIQKEMLPFKRKYFKRSRRILNAFDFPYSNGFTEGTNNKIKVIKRKAYGFRNFENFRNRILMTSI